MSSVSHAARGPLPQSLAIADRPSSTADSIRRVVFILWSLITDFLSSGVARMVIACGTSAILVVLKDNAILEGLWDWRVGLIVAVAAIFVIPGNMIETLKVRVKGLPTNSVRNFGSGDRGSGARARLSNLLIVGWIVGVHGGLSDRSLIRIPFFEPVLTCEAMEQADPDIAGFGVRPLHHLQC